MIWPRDNTYSLNNIHEHVTPYLSEPRFPGRDLQPADRRNGTASCRPELWSLERKQVCQRNRNNSLGKEHRKFTLRKDLNSQFKCLMKTNHFFPSLYSQILARWICTVTHGYGVYGCGLWGVILHILVDRGSVSGLRLRSQAWGDRPDSGLLAIPRTACSPPHPALTNCR